MPAGASWCTLVPVRTSSAPVDVNGNPVGFTCQDVGGSALLVWNASQQTGNISITGGIRTVNFSPGPFTVGGTFVSNGPLAFVGNGVTINGSVMGSSVLIAGLGSKFKCR